MQLYVGSEPDAVPYCETDLTPGAQEFRGLGEHTAHIDGVIDTGSPNQLTTIADTFTADMVGHAVWILEPASGATGNEGPRRITAIVDAKNATLGGTAFTADQEDVHFRIKTYAGDGYLTMLHREDTEIMDGSASYSAINKLHRAMLVNYGEGDELDWCGRQVAVARLRGMGNEMYRRVQKVLGYLAKTTIYSIELILDALFPQGGWEIYEDLINHPCTVFISVPTMALSNDPSGRGYLDMEESLTSTTTTSITVTLPAITIESVRLTPIEQTLLMAVLPSADSPAWTYVNEGDVEGNVFSIVSSATLQHAQTGGTAVGGRYRRTITGLEGDRWRIRSMFQAGTLTAVNGYPWQMIVRDGEREVSLMWDDTGLALGQSDETTVVTASHPAALTLSRWNSFELERDGDWIYARVNGQRVLAALASSFAADANTDMSFGYVNNGNNQNWTVNWDNVEIRAAPLRDYWNLRRDDGATVNPATLNSASALFVAGDTGKQVRLYSDENENYGVWLATYSSATQLTLAGIQRTGADVASGTSYDTVTLSDPWFHPKDVGKDITTSGSALLGAPNDLTTEILAYVSPYQVRVAAGTYTDETGLTWEFTPNFTVEANLRWELIDAASEAAQVLTLREALPSANTDVDVQYTTVLSGQVLLHEFIQNLQVAPDLYWPLYLWDIDAITRALMDMITAAGVIPEYERED
jgi:hypothetical protein